MRGDFSSPGGSSLVKLDYLEDIYIIDVGDRDINHKRWQSVPAAGNI